MRTTQRIDHVGSHRNTYNHNRKKILASQDICALCGKPVDKRLKFPHPMAPTIDHIVPIDLGGHPSDISNLQLAHNCCNRAKSNKVKRDDGLKVQVTTNRDLPISVNLSQFE